MNSTSANTSSLSLRASPHIQSIEARLNLPGALSRAGYLSVFDIIRHPKSRFIRRNNGLLKKQSEQAYDLALGLANQVRRAFRKNQLTASVQKTLPRTLSGQRAFAGVKGGVQQGLMTGGPSWQTQFSDDWSGYCQSGAPEANDSPVAYLSWLYDQALSFEQSASEVGLGIITLAERRPDLPSLMVDDEAINQVVPSLQLVNQILEAAITPSITDSTVDEKLAVTRYPSLLPYHFPHDQVELALDNAEVPLSEVIGQTDTSWPYFVSSTLAGSSSEQACALGSQLAPGQQTIITEATNAASTAFYTANFGYDTDSYSPFSDADLLAYQTGVAVPQLEQLLAGTAGGSVVLGSSNVDDITPDAGHYGAAFINMGKIPPIEMSQYLLISATTLSDKKNSGTPAIANDFVFYAPGNFNGGIILDGAFNPEFYLNYDLSINDSALVDYSMAFWCKVAAGEGKDMSLVTTNKTGTYAESGEGITVFLCVGDDGDYTLALNISDGTTYTTTSETLLCPADQWFLVAITLDVENKIIKLYSGVDGDESCSSISIDFTDFKSITESGGVWGFNGNKGNSYYGEYPDRWGVTSYDDITVWGNRILTESEVYGFIGNNKSGGGYSGMSHYYLLDTDDPTSRFLSNLSDLRMDRINRMVRLQRWLDLPYEQVDLLLSACVRAQGINNTDFSSNIQTLRMLGVFRHFQQKYQVTAYQFAAVIDQITPYAISPNVPFFDQVFNSPSLFETPFAITGVNFNYPPTTPDDERIVKQLCAGLRLSEAQFGVLASHVMTQLGNSTNKTLPCTLPVASAFYRLAMLPRWMGLPFAEGAALFSLLADGQTVWSTLAGIPLLAKLDSTTQLPTASDILDVLMALDSAADWAKNHTQSWISNYLVLQDTLTHPVPTTDILNVVTGINQQLPAALLTEADFDSAGVPAAPGGDGWMDALSDLVDANGLVLPVAPASGATVYDTLNTAVTTVVAKMVFDASVTLTDEQIASSLTTVIYQALLTQNGIADSALAQLLDSPQSLSTFLLKWAGDSEHRLLSDTLTLAGIMTPADIPDAYLQALYQLARRAAVVTQYHLTPATLNCFLANPTWFGVTDSALTLTLLYRLSRYADWLTLSGKEDAVLAYLNWVNQSSPPAADTDTDTDTDADADVDAATAATALAVLLGWDSSEVTDAAARFGKDGVALTVSDVDGVMRLQTLSKETGLSVTPLLSTGTLTLSSDYSAWQAAGESLVAAQSAQ